MATTTPDTLDTPRRASTGRRLLKILLGLLALLIVAIGVCEWQGWPFMREPLQRTLSKKLQRPVELATPFKAHLLGSIRLQTASLRIGQPSWRHGDGVPPDFLRADQAVLELPYSTLWNLRKPASPQVMNITRLEVAALQADLARDAQGRASWEFGPRSEKPKDRGGLVPQVGHMVIKDGRLLVDDQVMKVQVDAKFHTTEGRDAGPNAGLHAEGQGRYLGRPLQARLDSSGIVPLVSSNANQPPVPITLQVKASDSELDFKGRCADLLHMEGLSGDFKLSGTSLARLGEALGLTLPTTPPFAMNGQASHKGDIWGAKVAALSVGRSRLNGQFNYDRGRKVPLLTGQLGGQRLHLADLAPAFGAPPQPKKARAPGERVLPQREFDIPSLRAMDADVKLNVAHVELGSLFAAPLSPLQGHLTLKEGVLQVQDVVANTSGGELRGMASIDSRQAKDPKWRADIALARVKLEQFLQDPELPGQDKPKARKTPNITGQLAARMKVTGEGNTMAKVLASLDGQGQAWIREGSVSHLVVELAGLDLAQALGVAISGDKTLPLQCAVWDVDIRNGQVIPKVAVMDTPDSTLLMSGMVSLSTEKMDVTLTSHPKDFSPLTLRSPVRLTGTFSDPDVNVMSPSLGRKIAVAAGLAAVAPLAGVLALVDLGDKEKDVCRQAVQRMSPMPGKSVAGQPPSAKSVDKAPVKR